MKIFPIINVVIATALLFASSQVRAQQITFKAGDNAEATKLCVAAVSNNLADTKKYIKQISYNAEKFMSAKVKSSTRLVTCNNTDLVNFTAKYGATDTFHYLNSNAIRKYKIPMDEVKIIDITTAKANSTTAETNLVVMVYSH